MVLNDAEKKDAAKFVIDGISSLSVFHQSGGWR